MSLGALGDRGTIDSLVRRWQLDPWYSFNMSPEVVAVCDLGDMTELQLVMGWNRWMTGKGQPAVGAQFFRWNIFNPTASKVVLALEELWLSASAVTEYVLLAGFSSPLSTTIGAYTRDTRTPSTQGPNAVTSYDTNAVALTETMGRGHIAGAVSPVNVIRGGPILLWPGGAVAAGFTVANVAADFTAIFRERRFNDQENNL